MGEPPPRRAPWPWAMHWLAAWAVAGAVLFVCATAVIEFGLYDVRATRPHDAVIAWATHTTMIHSVQLRAGVAPAFSVKPEDVGAGLRLYDADCAACHGGPAVSRAAWASGLTPTPPYLLDASRRWTPAQLHFIIAGGVKMTAMPAWSASLTDKQIWQLVTFLEVVPYISGHDYQRMRTAAARR